MIERQLNIILQKQNKLLAKNEELEKLHAVKDDELALLREQVEYLTGKLYGRKKETIDINPNQSNLFDDSPFINPEQPGDKSDEVVVIKEHGRKRRKGLKQLQLAHLPTVDHIHEIESCACPTCKEAMKEVSTIMVRQEVKFIPACMENHRHFQKLTLVQIVKKQV